MKTLLAAIDFSPVTAQVTVVAAELARAFGARVVLLHVVEPVVVLVDFAVVSFSRAQIDEATVQASRSRLDRLKSELEVGGLAVTSVQAVGSPGHEILEQAEGLSADYIVLGSHGHGAWHDLVAGSTTHGVLKRARRSVIVVPAAAIVRDEARDSTKE